MTKRLNSKFKIDRSLGVNLWGRVKSPLNTRNYGPGQHGAKKKRLSDYCVQLKAKQRLKKYYGNIVEKQFRNIYKEAIRLKGDSNDNLIELLERRLDAVVYRMKLASSVFAARQMVSHGHILVNGKRVNIASYRVNDDDEIALVSSMKENTIVLDSLSSQEREVPEYIEFNSTSMKGRFIRAPKLIDVPYPVVIEPNLVIEFYSR